MQEFCGDVELHQDVLSPLSFIGRVLPDLVNGYLDDFLIGDVWTVKVFSRSDKGTFSRNGFM